MSFLSSLLNYSDDNDIRIRDTTGRYTLVIRPNTTNVAHYLHPDDTVKAAFTTAYKSKNSGVEPTWEKDGSVHLGNFSTRTETEIRDAVPRMITGIETEFNVSFGPQAVAELTRRLSPMSSKRKH